MIKIPIRKYRNTEKKHYIHIRKSIEDKIKFYINCCNAIHNHSDTDQLSLNINPILNKNTIKSFLQAISTEPYKELKNLADIFSNKKFDADFLNNIVEIKLMLEEMLDISSKIYFEQIIISKPDELMELYHYMIDNHSGIKTEGNQVFIEERINKGAVFNIMEEIFNYGKFEDGSITSEWDAYRLCTELNINVCPYCNRMYTFTVVKKEKNVTRPELDHFFPKSRFPIFALSFFNLIPSCKVCNSNLKKNCYLDLENYIHPYMDSLPSTYSFDFLSLDFEAMEGRNNNNKIFINRNGTNDEKSENTLKKFDTENIYNYHKELVPIFLKKYKYYPDSVINEISKLLNIHKEELVLSLYSPPNEVDIIDTSLGKFQTDLYKQFLKFYKL